MLSDKGKENKQLSSFEICGILVRYFWLLQTFPKIKIFSYYVE